MERLHRTFYEQDALTVARRLVGVHIVRMVGRTRMVARIVETEAYIAPEDKASHAYNGRRTKRTRVFYEPGGTAYVYLIYGMHHCLNVVTNEAEVPHAVLVRAAEPVEGIELMRRNRGRSADGAHQLTNGPGKLCSAMAIDRSFNGVDLRRSSTLFLVAGDEPEQIAASPRRNIDYAEEYRDKPWRFYDATSRSVSR
jgi:DNA-3-methyladenine glycosylase